MRALKWTALWDAATTAALAVGLGCATTPAEDDDEAASGGRTETGAGPSSSGSGAVDPTNGSGAGTNGATSATASTGRGTTAAPDACDVMGFLQSREAWEDARDANGNTYWYLGIRRTDPCCGVGGCCTAQTLIVVQEGTVVERRLFEPRVSECWDGTCPEPWQELGPEVGDHEMHELAVPPWTLDEVYASCCADVVLDDTPGVAPSIQFHDDGLLRLCFSNSGQGGFGPEGWGGDELSVLAIGFDAPPDEPLEPR